MEPLAAQLIAGLRGREPDLEILARAGAADPAEAAPGLLAAAADPDLAGSLEHWVPELLCSARPGFGAHCLAELAASYRRERSAPLPLAALPTLPRLLGSSNFLARLLLRHPAWLDTLREAGPAERDPVEPDWDEIRQAKYRGLLRIASRDLGGRPFEQSLSELSELADRLLEVALQLAADETGVEAPALLALGKLGGRELNFSSDVDLLFVYDPPRDADPLEHNHAVARLIRHLKQRLETSSSEGFAYRVDLDLRPEGRTGVLANSVDAALAYYETFGAEWERQMLIRLRPVAGPTEASQAFCQAILPFVYRRHIAPDVMHHVRDMKARIEEERRRAGRDIETELKEGPGGIRDVEFLVQAFQLFQGGRVPPLRTGNVLAALAELGALQLLPETITAELSEAYLWLRRAEHALQLEEERQTQRFPRKPAEQTALARRMGYADPLAASARSRLLEDWTAVRSRVRAHFDALVLSEAK